ncbi:cytochrome c-type biogenesis protein CcmH [Bacillus sp. S3]|uniref:cytochrome c-type biogenesis protein CcmH n=1 Tax=Bacillus sp. S3 TaxID=486398 RepID=UPI00118B9502|nr:cytochrome c-type biogenesis protein CcmH [Bacillus sp. S3]QCJ41033.1 cytochrome c-type biogenesis protein CcmH [Bacillus sp. S3]
MNARVKKGIFWGAAITTMILFINVIHYFVGGTSAFAEGRHGHGPGGPGGMRQHGDFGPPQHMMNGPHQGSGFHWLGTLLFLVIGIVILVLVVKWLRRKAKAASMQQFIDTSLMSSHQPFLNQNARMLDQWEKNITTKKESL